MSFPRYPKYKDSGVEWLGQVPEGWAVGTLSRFTATITDGAHVSPETENGVFPFVSTKDVLEESIDFDNCLRTSTASFEYMLKSGCRPLSGDVLFSKDGTIGRTVVVSEDRDFAVASSLIIIRPRKGALDAGFLNRVCQSAQIANQVETYVKGAGLPRLSIRNLSRVACCLPPIAEQLRIAAFLDREISKIDGLVAEQRRLLELLKEKRQAVISRAVTKGVNPDAPMKPSGIEWLGDVPTHWTVASVRRLICRIEQGWSPECHARPAEPEEWGVLKSGCVNRGVFAEQENKALPETLEPIPGYEIRAGDVLMSRASGSPELVGSTAFVSATRTKLMLSDKVFRLHTGPNLDQQFLVALFNSRLMRSQIERAISGAEGLANNLPQSALKAFLCAIPPLADQRHIVTYLAGECASLDNLSTEAQRAIDLLQERRTALISAAVTGQIDVRGFVEAA